MNKTAAVFVAITLLTLPVGAEEYARFLLPVYMRHDAVIGSSGRWTTELTALNASQTEIVFGPCAPGFPPDTCPPMVHALAGGALARNPTVGWTEAGRHGRFVWLLANRASDLRLDLALVRDGVQVAKLPVVRAEAFSARPLYLLNVPAESGGTLRIYGLDNLPGTTVRVRVATMPRVDHPAMTIAEHNLVLTQSPYVAPSGLPYAPSYAEMPIAAATGAVSIAVESLDGTAKVWAVASTVNGNGAVVVTQPQP